MLPGTADYADAAPALLRACIPFSSTHAPLLSLLPAGAANVLDVGAGPGHDAAAMARMGYRVVAIEPVEPLREGARQLHAGLAIDWRDDALPRLESIDGRYAVIIASGVWHHLDQKERPVAMARLATLLEPKGLLSISLRHGPIPDGRKGFAVTAFETIALANSAGLGAIVDVRRDSIQAANKAAGVTWTYLVFRSQRPSSFAFSPASAPRGR